MSHRVILMLLVLMGLSMSTSLLAADDSGVFVRVSPRDPHYFELSDGKPYIPIGFDLVRAPREEEFEHILDTMAANKINYCRVWLNDLPWQTSYPPKGDFPADRAKILLKFLDMAGKRGIRVKLCIEEFRQITTKKVVDKDNAVLHKANGGPFTSMQEFMYTKPGQDLFLKKVAFYREHIGDHPAVFGWELWNEMNYVKADWFKWTELMLPELHQSFPKNMVMQSLGSFANPKERPAYQQLCEMKGNDVAQVHRYLDMGAVMEVCHGPVDMLAADAVHELQAFNPQKPIMLAETGAVAPKHSGSWPLLPKDKEGLLLHDVIFSPFFSGAAATGHIWFWREAIEKPNLWHHFARFAKAIEGIDPPAEHFEPVMVKNPRLRVYLLKGKTTLLMWCRDNKNDWKSGLEDGVPPQRLENLTLDLHDQLGNFAPKTVQAYSPWTDTTTDLTLKDGQVTLPPFQRSIVVRIK